MPTYKQLPKPKPKVADEFKTALEHAFHWVNVNWRPVLAGIGAIAVVTAAILLISSYIGTKNEKASELLFNATAKSGAEMETELAKVFDTYPRTPSARIARLKLGNVLYDRDEYAKAVEVLSPLARESEAEVRILALHAIAANKLASNDAAGAAKAYMDAYNDNGNLAKGASYYQAALAYEAAGKIDDAQKIFEELAKDDNKLSSPGTKAKSKDHLIWMASHK